MNKVDEFVLTFVINQLIPTRQPPHAKDNRLKQNLIKI